jgi:HEAT repeat protein
VTLGQIADPRAAPALESLAASSDPDTAYAAKTALARVKPG